MMSSVPNELKSAVSRKQKKLIPYFWRVVVTNEKRGIDRNPVSPAMLMLKKLID